MGFYAFGTRFQSRLFARKDISWRVRKLNAKQNRFQIVTFFLLFSSAYFLDIMSPMFPQVLESTFSTDPWLSWADPEGGTGGPDPPSAEKSQKIRVSKQYWSRSPEKSQSYQASIQCWVIIGPPASYITFWICAWLYFKELYFRKDIHKRLFN